MAGPFAGPTSGSGGRFPIGDGLARRYAARGQRVVGYRGRRGGMSELLRGQGIGEAGQGVGAGGKTGFGQNLVDDRLERRDRQQLAGEAVAEAETSAVAAATAASAAATQ